MAIQTPLLISKESLRLKRLTLIRSGITQPRKWVSTLTQMLFRSTKSRQFRSQLNQLMDRSEMIDEEASTFQMLLELLTCQFDTGTMMPDLSSQLSQIDEVGKQSL